VPWGRGGAFARSAARRSSRGRRNGLGDKAWGRGWGEMADGEAALHMRLGQHDRGARDERRGVAAVWARARHVVRRCRGGAGLQLERGSGL
jgi:hypothetical protein